MYDTDIRNKVEKTFVLNPHAVLSSSDSLLRFGEDNEVVVPMAVLEKIQNTKRHLSFGKRKVAKDILNYINAFDKKVLGEGVIQENGCILMVATNYHDINLNIDGIDDYDRRALQVAKGLQEKGKNVVFITNNIVLQIKAKSIGIKAETFRDELYPVPAEQYTGRITCEVSKEATDKLFRFGEISIEDIYEYEKYEFLDNMFVFLKSAYRTSAVGRVEGSKIVRLKNLDRNIYGILPKNTGQKFMLEALMSDAPLVVIKGDAGTGKTFCSLAAALQQYDEGIFKQILVARPMQTVADEKIGYLPGDIDDKVGPYLGGIKDNLRELLKSNDSNLQRSKKNSSNSSKYEDDEKPSCEDGEYFFEKGIIRIQPIGYIRGRTILDTFFIFDETQNIDPEDIKTIVSRMGEGSKLVFLGDPSQVDNPKLNERYNGLVYLSERMKGEELCYQIALDESESVRSKLAKLAIKKL